MTDMGAETFEGKRPYDPWLDGPPVWDGTVEVIEIPLPQYDIKPAAPPTKEQEDVK